MLLHGFGKRACSINRAWAAGRHAEPGARPPADLAMAKAHLSTAEERLRALNTEPKSQEIAAQEALIKRRCRLR